MVDSRKAVSARKARRTSRKVQNATIGSHVQPAQSARHASRTRPSDSVQFSDSTRQTRARRQEVEAIAPRTSTAEAAVYQRHAMQHKYVEEMRHRERRRRIITIVVAALIVLAIAGAAGIIAFMNSTSSAMALNNSDAKEELSAPKEGKGTYTLIAVELGAAAAPLNAQGPEVLLLVYANPAGDSLSLVNIPGSLQVTLEDNVTHAISEAALSGDAALIRAVEKFSAVDITHYVKFDDKSLAELVDALGGIPMDLSQEIDDPHAGDVYLAPGSYVLDGHQAIVMLRCSNLKLGLHDQMDNQLSFAANMLEKFFSVDGTLGFASRLDAVGTYLQTDMSSSQLIGIADGLKSITADQMSVMALPGYTMTESGLAEVQGSRYSAKADTLRALLNQIEAGEAPSLDEGVDLSNIDPGSFSIEIQNGASVVGAAAATQKLLEEKGFNVEEIGNAEQPVYTETLVVSKGEDADLHAQMVIQALGMGRIVTTPEYYDFDTDVLLILGSDYRPIN